VNRSVPRLESLTSEIQLSLYKQFKFELPKMTQVSVTPQQDTIHAVPAKTRTQSGMKIETTPACFSTVLARNWKTSHRLSRHTKDTPGKSSLHGMSVYNLICAVYSFKLATGLDIGCVRAIFKVPEEFVMLAGTEPLVYIE
jgi:hypothetical protein